MGKYKSAAQQQKALAKGRATGRKFQEMLGSPSTVLERLEEEVAILKSQIKNCESDLQGEWKNNEIVMTKTKLLKKRLGAKLEEIEQEKLKNAHEY